MTKHRYKSRIINILGFIGLLLFAILFIRGYILDASFSSRIYWFLALGIIIVLATIGLAYPFLTTHLKRRYVVINEDKISIPDDFSFSYDHVFFYERITHLQIIERYARYSTRVWIDIQYGKFRKAKIEKSLLESEAVFLEIYNAIKDKVNPDTCHMPPPRFRIF
jgi:hypothetical protein